MRVVSVDGGLKDNAIPVESFAVVVVSDEKKSGEALEKFGDDLKMSTERPIPTRDPLC